MMMTDVVNLLASLHVKASPGPLGVTFEWYFDDGCYPKRGNYKYRVENGSGIAGRGGWWNVRELPEGTPLGPKVPSARLLRRQILAAMAEGPRPPDRAGYETYVRWHTCGITSSVQWFQRRKRGVGC